MTPSPRHRLPKGAFLIEASWEVCNKVGGIHTVLTSKMMHAQAVFSERYLTVGPLLNPEHPSPDFHPEPAPNDIAAALEQLSKEGIEARYGTWLTDGEPAVVLVGWQNRFNQIDAIKTRLWEGFKLDTLGSPPDADEPLLWSLAVGRLVHAIAEKRSDPVLFHGHEWLAAGAFLSIAEAPLPNLHTVFTTHATVLGRALASQNIDIYTGLKSIVPDKAAREHNVVAKHQLERLAAVNADVFTTVSSLTGREATHFLGKKPDVITENGLNMDLFPMFSDLEQLRRKTREQLNRFLEAYFFGSYRFDVRSAKLQFTMGRYETHNKGYDTYIRSLAQLNAHLKESRSNQTVVALFMVPGDTGSVRPEVRTQLTVHSHLERILAEALPHQADTLRHTLWDENGPSETVDNALNIPQLHDAAAYALARLPHIPKPPLSPYVINRPNEDAISRIAKECGLENAKEDRVKIVLLPVYFDGFDGLFNRSLYDLISGCDLGVFPSWYEPWGYTPMESLATGSPTVTSNLAGFGNAIEEKAPGNTATLYLEREGKSDDATVVRLTELLLEHAEATPQQWQERRLATYGVARQFDWSILYPRYTDAYSQAISES